MTEQELQSIIQSIIENRIQNEVQHVTERSDGMSAKQTAKEFVKLYLELYKEDSIKQSSYDRLQTSYKAMNNYPIADMNIEDITHMDIQKFVRDLTKDGYAKTTVKKNARVLTAALKFAAANRIIPYDPTVCIKFPRQTEAVNRDVSAYSVEEQEKLLPVLRAHFTYFSLIIQFMLETGLRVGEAIALDWTDIDLQKRSVSVTKTNVVNRGEYDGPTSFIQDSPKTHSSNREVPLTDRAIEILRRCGSKEFEGQHSPVFKGRKYDRLNYNGLIPAVRRFCEEAGVDYKGTHVFRHTFATNAYHNGMNIKVLSRILGHASVQVTYDTYINLFGDGFKDLQDAMDAAFGQHAQKQG